MLISDVNVKAVATVGISMVRIESLGPSWIMPRGRDECGYAMSCTRPL